VKRNQSPEAEPQGDRFFAVASRALAAGEVPEALEVIVADATFADRFCGAASGLATRRTQPLDWAVLVRQLVRREDEREWGQAADVLMGLADLTTLFGPPPAPPIARLEPSGRFASKEMMAAYEQVGLRATQGEGGLVLRAQPWAPEWLDGYPARAAEAELLLRRQQFVPGDPLLAQLGRGDVVGYSGAAQRDAVRAAAVAPPGSTLLVNLPTGTGKSLVAHLPAVAAGGAAGDAALTVLVVPTVALCIDQERSLRSSINQDCAYYGGRSAEELKAIRQRIFAGEQRVVVASPEPILGALRPAIYAAAGAGRLRWLVVDEAHVVGSWGDEFRPEFQMLPGLRRDLLRVTEAAGRPAFRTMLLSATVTADTLATLHTAFGDPGPFNQAAAPQLRPEPSYWFSSCRHESSRAAEAIRRRRVEEAVLHLPRPLVLYVTRREDAEWWYKRLQDMGLGRLGIMTGSTPADARAALLRRWSERAVDVVVATSAFGLGVDQSDVRSVVHATLPETLDRFYQEVGRGGRDGRASVSLLIHTDEDVTLARSVGETTLIGNEKGVSRWRRMWESKDAVDAERARWRIRVDVSPGLQANEANVKWNLRTLALMARSGLIRIDAVPPPSQPRGSDDVQAERAYEQAAQEDLVRRVVEVIADRVGSDDVWTARVDPQREREQAATRAAFARMVTVAGGGSGHCIGTIIGDLYRVGHNAVPGVSPTPVATACGTCPACRSGGYASPIDPPPPVRPPWPVSRGVASQLQRRLIDGRLIVQYDTSGRPWRDDLGDLIPRLSDLGLRGICVSAQEWDDAARVLGSRVTRGDVLLFELSEVLRTNRRHQSFADVLAVAVVHPSDGRPLPEDLYRTADSRDTRLAPRVLLVPNNALRHDGVRLVDRPPVQLVWAGSLL
jgi:superfamily II DNA/RNA helicase